MYDVLSLKQQKQKLSGIIINMELNIIQCL